MFLDSCKLNCKLVLCFMPFHKIGNWKAKVCIPRNWLGFEKLSRDWLNMLLPEMGVLKQSGHFWWCLWDFWRELRTHSAPLCNYSAKPVKYWEFESFNPSESFPPLLPGFTLRRECLCWSWELRGSSPPRHGAIFSFYHKKHFLKKFRWYTPVLAARGSGRGLQTFAIPSSIFLCCIIICMQRENIIHYICVMNQ